MSGPGGRGGAISVVDGSLQLIRSTFSKNHATQYGGAVNAVGVNVHMEDSSFHENRVETAFNIKANTKTWIMRGPTGLIKSGDIRGGGVFAHSAQLALHNVTFSSCSPQGVACSDHDNNLFGGVTTVAAWAHGC